MFILYVAGKYALYCCISALAFRMFRIGRESVWSFALTWGALRMLIGLVFILPIILLGAQFDDWGFPEALNYVVSFGAMRMLAWLVFFLLLAWQYKLRLGKKACWWIGAGVSASFISDALAVVTGVSELRFFC